MFMSTAKLEYVTGALLAINAVSSLYLVIESAHDVTVKGELSNFNKLQEYWACTQLAADGPDMLG